MNEQNDKSKLIQLSGLWKSANGKALTGSLGGARLVIMPNQFKKEDKHPDYVLFIAPREEQNGKRVTETKDDLPF